MPVYHSISSASNPLLKDVRRAISKGTLTGDGDCVAESLHLLKEALRSQCAVTAVLAAESARESVESILREEASTKVALLPDLVFDSVAGTRTSQGVIALVTPPSWPLEHLFSGRALVLVLDAVQDPGNAGTLVRAGEAFGATGVIFVKGSASPYHPKTLRAAAGSLFRVPFAPALDPVIARAALERNRLTVYAGMPESKGQLLSEVDLRGPCAFVVGNEGAGVGAAFRSASTALTIPTATVESLNASIAGAIFLYEAHRQRRS